MSQNNPTEEEAKKAAEAAAQAEAEKNKNGEDDTTDYKKLYEDTKTELGQAQHKIIELKKKPSDDDDKNTLDKDTIKSVVNEALSEDRTLRVNEIVDEELSKISTNPDEQKLIKLLYENKIVKVGDSRSDIRKDLEAAKILANANKTEAKQKELEDAAKNKAGAAGAAGSGGGNFDSDFSNNSAQLNNAEQALLSRYGVDPSKVKN